MSDMITMPEEIKMEELKLGFPEGATLIYQCCKNKPGYVWLFSTLREHATEEEITDCMLDVFKKFAQIGEVTNLKCMFLNKVTPNSLALDAPAVYGRKTFWMDADREIRDTCERVKSAFHVSNKKIHLFYAWDEEADKITYFGYSIQKSKFDFEPVEVGGTKCSCSYDDFLDENLRFWEGEIDTYTENLEMVDAAFDDFDEDDLQVENSCSGVKSGFLEGKIRTFLKNTPFSKMLTYMEARVKGQPELSKVLAGVYHYLQCIAQGKPCRSNILLAAPSGCGKTETFRALRDFMKKKLPEFPVIQYDMTSVTEEGFKGPDTVEIVKGLFGNRDSGGIGIVFMDEFDKKLSPSFASGGNNVNAAVQAQILTLIEGREIFFHDDKIDTNKTLFIGLGSFDACRTKRETKRGGLGFGATVHTEQEDHYHPITRQEMIELGASYELLGRFQIIANYYRLPKKMINEIINKQVRKLASSIGYSIRVTAALREQLWLQANGNYGCRMLENTLVDSTMQILPRILLENADQKECTIVLDRDGQSRIEQKRSTGRKREHLK